MTDVTAGSGPAPSSSPADDAATEGHEAGGFAAIDAAAGGSSAPLSHPQEQAASPGADATRPDEGQGGGDEAGRLQASLKKIAERAEEVRAWGADRQEAARDLVEAKPLTVLGAALGVGILLGLVASRV